MNKLNQLAEYVATGRANDVTQTVLDLLNQGEDPNNILHQGLLKGMLDIGNKWKDGQAFIPEVLIAARAMNRGTALLEQSMNKQFSKQNVTIIIGTVFGDMHDIGKNLVAMMLKSKGFQVIDLGVNVSAQTFLDKALEHKAQFVCMSALLTTTMLYFKTVVDLFKNAHLDTPIRLLCGGAPVTEAYSESVGCDFYANDAVECANLIERLVSESV